MTRGENNRIAVTLQPPGARFRGPGEVHMRAIGIVGGLVVLCSASLALALDAAAAETAVEGRLSAVRSCLSSAPEDAHGGLTITLYLSGTGAVRQTEITRRGPG